MTGAVDLSGLKQQGSTAHAPGGVEVTEANFEAEVLLRSGEAPVVVLLWSPRSEACVQLADALAALSAADGDKWSLATVNIDTAPRVASMFGIEAVPTVVALAGGQPLASFEGPQPPGHLRRWVDSLLAATAGKFGGETGSGEESEEESVDPELAAAREKLDAGEFADAAAAYQAILDADPNHREAKGALRQIAFLERAGAAPPEAMAAADAAPDDIDAAFAAADTQILGQDTTGAFDRLIGLIKRTSGDERSRVRTRLIELFELFDPAEPDVITGRRNLANALY